MAKSRPTSSAPKRAVFSSSSTKPARSTSTSTSKKANNISGFAHRQSLKDPSLSLDPLDAFDLITQKHKRSDITTELSRDEAGTGKGRGGGGGKRGGEDEDEEEGEDAVRERIRKMISGEGDGVVEDDDDEEVDSDGAWEEMGEDQMGWGGAFMTRTGRKKGSKKSKTSSKPMEINLDEDEEYSSDNAAGPSSRPSLRFQLPDSHNQALEDDADASADDDFDSDEGGSTGFMDLSTMLDGPMSDREDFNDDGAQSEDDEGMSEDDDEDEDEDSEDDDDEEMDDEDEGALDQLGAFVSALKSGKRKAGEDGDEEDGGAQRTKRRVLKDRGEDGRKEGDFGAPLAKGTKLSLSALLQPLPQSASLSLLKTAKALAPAALAAPLPTRAQDKLDREAAYDATKEEVEKWAPAMKRIKEAEHLSFPLQAQKKGTASSSEMTAKFKPSNDLESAVANLLASAQMSEADLAKTEDLAMNHLTLEEVAARRAELGRLRELMFRAEAKNKRVAKIKSKAYRKIAKKEREKNASKIAAAGFGSDEEGEDAQMERERKRATERATLRHKNTGKWAKSMLGRTELDVDQRRELNEQLEQGERLKRKIQGNDGEEEESSSEEEGEGLDDIKRKAFNQLEDLDAEIEEEVGGKKKGGGLFGMKFMQDGMARAQVGADARADALRKELVTMEAGDDEDRSGDEDERAGGPSFVSVGGNPGRMLYGTGAVSIPKTVAPPSEISVASTSTLQSSHLSPPLPSTIPRTNTTAPTPAAESNPWLTAANDTSSGPKISRKKNIVEGGKNGSNGVDKVAVQLKKGLKKTDEGKAREREDAEVEIDLEVSLAGTAKKGKGKAAAETTATKSKSKPAEGGAEDDSSDEDGDDDLRVGPTAFRQRDLVAQAFAGDNVIEDFASEKRREEEEDAPREEDLTLPGWGAWGGRGVKKSRNPKKFIKKVAGIDVAKRHDFGKSNVIISEKKDKKAAKYQTKDLPYPYTSAAQYEASLSQAVGTEWATRTTHQKLTMPRVVVKKGAVIHPLEKGKN